MTNGEKIKNIFPNVEIMPDPYSPSVDIQVGGIMMMRVDRNWWNAEYKEPTTKNDLGIDAVSRQAVDRLVLEFIRKTTDESIAFYEHFLELPSVTPQEPRKGHWIGHGEHCRNLGVIPSGLGAYEWCSNCDCGIDVREWHRNHYNYCPNCGSDNREVEA